jgi:NAD(P)-dependent dehydrogenase (short-subunit alcohol dehydrogenase family)
MTKKESTSKVAVVVGASSGIGRATALRFARQGCRVVLASRGEEALAELKAEIDEIGADALVVPTDVTKWKQVHHLADATVERFGRIDVWVNDAGVSVFAPFLEMPLDDFRQVIDVDLLGVVYGSRAALEAMTRQGSGTLINLSSIVGEVPQPYTSPYGMAKAAVRALGVSLRSELALQKHRHIHVCTVLPSTIDTPFFDHAGNYSGRRVKAMPPVYAPERVARTITGLVSHPHAEVMIGPAGAFMARSHRMMPRLFEAQMALQTEGTHLSRTVGARDTTGILYEPIAAGDGAVEGGWDGAGRTMRRRVAFWGLLAGGVVAALRFGVLKARSS